jgi:FkbM family methyltransferase
MARFRAPEFDEMAMVHDVLRERGRGVLVDVGAHFGGSLSRFADDGWRVFAFEPDSRNRAILVDRIRGNENVTVDGRAVGERDGEIRSLYTSRVSTGISALEPFHPSHRPTHQVETVRLDTFLEGVDAVTVLKTDTEGYDLPVLRTFPWHRLHPRAVVCEFEDRKTVPLGYTYHDLASYLLNRGYAVFVSEWRPVVEYGRRHRWRALRRYPSELDDKDSWGNIIAVEMHLAAAVEDAGRKRAFTSRLR